ncbi:hypothetical protein ACKFKG_19295 [Phormidesmis sp. 146-35]
MAVRLIFPDSVAFTSELHLSTGRRYRVQVTLDLQERFLIVASGILPDIGDSIQEFVSQLSEIVSNQLALLKWDGTSDLMTEYQLIRILPTYRLQRSFTRFDIVMDDPALIYVEELNTRTTIQL